MHLFSNNTFGEWQLVHLELPPPLQVLHDPSQAFYTLLGQVTKKTYPCRRSHPNTVNQSM